MKKSSINLERIDPPINEGLTSSQVKLRVELSKNNVIKSRVEKSYLKIILDNLFNPFNLILIAIAVFYLLFVIYLYHFDHKDIADSTFGVSKFAFVIPALLNSFVSVFQEIRAKKIVNKLKIVTESKANVIRDSKEEVINICDIVIDDIIHYRAGNQASVDSIVKDGECQVDESLITGESTLISKSKGDKILSGSSIIIGDCHCLVTSVGDDTYIASITRQAKSIAMHKSDLIVNINKLIKFLSIFLIIIALTVSFTMVYKIGKWGNDTSVFSTPHSLNSLSSLSEIILTVGTFAIGVVPTGLVLITSCTLAISIYKLAKEKTLTQNLYSLENLSRVDTLCLDKTGTLTDGSLKLEKTIFFDDEEEVKGFIQEFLFIHSSYNATTRAIFDVYGCRAVEIKEKDDYSSISKTSSITYLSGDVLTLGAIEYLLDSNSKEYLSIIDHLKDGKRLLAMTKNEKVIAIFILNDNLRSSAKETIYFFYENNIDIKIISGDNPITVSSIARKCGIKDYDKAISLENVKTEDIPSIVSEYTIFSRSNPEQKLAIIQALKDMNRKVAMTGDGVNDILALKKADASITFKNATDASKACADVVLLDDDFSHLKEVVFQGRRVVNNVEKTSILFLMKTTMIILLTFLLIPFKKGQLLFSIENIYVMQTSTSAIGGFLLSLETNHNPHKGTFKENVIPKAMLAGLLVTISVILPIILNASSSGYIVNDENLSSLISILTTISGIIVIVSISFPLNRYRTIVLSVVISVSILLGLAFPTSCIGGKVSTFSMFNSNTGNIFDAQIFKEFFQPWNSKIVTDLLSAPSTYVIIGCFIIIFLPIYIFIMNRIKLCNM